MDATFDRRSRRMRAATYWSIFSLVLIAAATASANPGLVEDLHDPQAEHIDQAELVALVDAGMDHEAFELAFEGGDELFEVTFNVLDGVGANVGQGQRFTRVPRADLTGPGEWANHTPPRATGPNGQSCNSCHNQPFDDGAGGSQATAHRDPTHSGEMSRFIIRNTPHLFAPGALQRLAEEMTTTLHSIRDQAARRACQTGNPSTRRLKTKDVDFGRIRAVPVRTNPCEVDLDTSGVRAVDADLVVRPFQWKGSDPTIRAFNRDASHNELGMQPVELVGDGVDGDFDGVTNEMTVGDQTALAIYLAAQPRPTSLLELSQLGLIDPLPAAQRAAILTGRSVFSAIRCTSCHRSKLRIDDPIFSEPSQQASHRDSEFPGGQDPIAEGVDPSRAVTFDLTRDQPDNVIQLANGSLFRLGSLPRDSFGRGIVELFGDLRRHDLGPDLAENIDEVGTGASTWLTKELWGVGSTGPYLHDGRASTLAEAILAHGGEAATSRRYFETLPSRYQADLIAFLDNLVLFKMPEE